ncbi:N-6 DNA methylase [Sphingosinicella sp.]|uniref:N-6 DNA methylase n=1 Tax=Sphingosinicella sp. TaxID=1917971 RepID=UPI004037C530
MPKATTALKAKLLSQAIRDPLFGQALETAATEIAKASVAAANEATVESAFERILYAVLKDIGLDFHPQKEMPLKTRRHVKKGRTDSRIGALIIEYKQPSTLRSAAAKAKAIGQLSEYAEALVEELSNDVVGFLTDGVEILEIRAGPDGNLSESSFAPVSPATLLRLVRSIIALEKSALTADNLIRDFCGAATDGIVFETARKLNKILSSRPTAKSEMLRSEWEALFRLAHEDQSQQRRIEDRRQALSDIFGRRITQPVDEYRALFSLHTAYAIILKMIAYRVVSDVKFGSVSQDYKSLTGASSEAMRAFVARLEDGELFRDIGILNLLEGDFFSWYADEDQWSDSVAGVVREILATLARYEDVNAIFDQGRAVDLFRQLYEATVPQAVRSSLGEFYTPYWLAEHVLETSRPSGAWNALDPCCGSGTFLIAAIARLRAENQDLDPAALARQVLKRVCGIDLNPLAVLTARIHFFIHIADLLDGVDDDIALPVYLGDASNIPVRRTQNGVEFIHYELSTLKTPLSIDIPAYLSNDLLQFAKLMFAFEQSVKAGDYAEAKAGLLGDADVKGRPAIVRHRLVALADQIIDLEKREWNGIWARIVANFAATAAIGPFTNIIGNPPWIDWKSLPSGYREKVKALCVDKGLFSGAGRTGGINLNVCALIAHVAAANWLAKGGRMALLMPRELASQASYEGWRRTVGGASCSLVEFHDWSDAGHPFDPVKEDFMTFVFHAKRTKQSRLPAYRYAKRERSAKAHAWSNWLQAESKLKRTKAFAGQIVEGSSAYTFAPTRARLDQFAKVAGHCPYVGREGIEFYPQELLLFKYEGVGPKPGLVWVRNVQVAKSKYRIPSQRIALESKHLYPLVKGPFIERMSYDDPDILAVFPYEKSRPHTPIPIATLRKEAPHLLGYLRKYRKILEQQTHYSDAIRADGEFYGLARTGPYSFNDCYVAFRDNSKWRATVVTEKTMPWKGRKRFLFQNHAVSICEYEDRLITEDEAFYVAGIFNAPIVAEFIYASSDSRSFKIRPPVYVPPFDSRIASHRKIVVSARKMASSKSADSIAVTIERLYLALCDARTKSMRPRKA